MTVRRHRAKVTNSRLAQVLKAEAEIATAQRLGFVLESLESTKLAPTVRKWLPDRLQVVSLATHAPRRASDPVSEAWGVLVNAQGMEGQ